MTSAQVSPEIYGPHAVAPNEARDWLDKYYELHPKISRQIGDVVGHKTFLVGDEGEWVSFGYGYDPSRNTYPIIPEATVYNPPLPPGVLPTSTHMAALDMALQALKAKPDLMALSGANSMQR